MESSKQKPNGDSRTEVNITRRLTANRAQRDLPNRCSWGLEFPKGPRVEGLSRTLQASSSAQPHCREDPGGKAAAHLPLHQQQAVDLGAVLKGHRLRRPGQVLQAPDVDLTVTHTGRPELLLLDRNHRGPVAKAAPPLQRAAGCSAVPRGRAGSPRKRCVWCSGSRRSSAPGRRRPAGSAPRCCHLCLPEDSLVRSGGRRVVGWKGQGSECPCDAEREPTHRCSTLHTGGPWAQACQGPLGVGSGAEGRADWAPRASGVWGFSSPAAKAGPSPTQ